MTREEYAALTDEEKRIKVADLHGDWSNIRFSEDIWPEGIEEGWQESGVPFGHHDGHGHPEHMVPLPDYINDLNAMHDAEKVFVGADRFVYWHEINNIVMGTVHTAFATAAQRAEAFLKTLNLWTD